MAHPWVLAAKPEAVGDAGGDRCRPAWPTPGGVCAGHRGVQQPKAVELQGPWAGARGLVLAARAAATRPCRLLFARDGFSSNPVSSSASSALHAPGAGTSGTNFQLRRNGDTR